MLYLAADAADTSATASGAFPYVVTAFVLCALLLYAVLAANSPAASALGHSLFGSPVALLIFCSLCGWGLIYGLPRVLTKMDVNLFNLGFQREGLVFGIAIPVFFFLIMFKRLLTIRRKRAWRGY